jgi:hypothetical protein
LPKAFVCKDWKECISEKERLEYALYGQEKGILSGQDADWTHSFLASIKLRCGEKFIKGEGKSIVKYLPMGTKIV